MSMKTIGLVVAVVLASVASATDFTLKEGVSGIFDWTDGRNYVGDVAPTQKELSATDRDAVVVPENVTVVISNEMPNASLALINSLARIRPNGYQTKIVFAVAETKTLTLDCAVNYEGEQSNNQGWLVKEGEGALYLSAQPGRYTYGGNYDNAFYVHMKINGGTLKFNQSSKTAKKWINFGRVFVSEGATWIPPYPSQLRMLALTGAGAIENEASVYQYLYAKEGTAAEPLEFAGAVKGWLTLAFQEKSYYNLTGTNSTGCGTFVVLGNHTVEGGRIGIRKFGRKGEPSSIGAQSDTVLDSENGFWLTSLRRPDDPVDVCDKIVQMYSGDGQGVVVFDGGAVGGLQLTGVMRSHASELGQKRIVLTGSNVQECVMSSVITRVTDPAYATGGHTFHFTKRGSGTWRMANASSGLSGAIAVEDGTLKFDSIANRGTASSLGTALDLYRPVDSHGSALTEADQVGYAFLLGDGTEAHEGNFEYSGSASALCTTRPLALNGKGRLTNGSAHGFTFADVYAVGAGKNVLTLDGDDASANNVLSGINDRKDAAGGPISIVKEGEGTWKLTGDLSLRGSIAVKKGTLVVQNNYTWYKWVVKSCYQEALGKSDIQFNLGEFGLYDAAGVRQNLGMTAQRADAGGNAEYPNLQPGHIDYGFTSADQFKPQGAAASYPRNLAKLVDDIITTGQISFWYQTKPDSDYYKGKTGGQSTYRNVPHNEPNQDTTWMPIVMRLKDDAMPIAYYDYATATANLREAYRTVLYGSVDGTNWEALESEDQCRAPVAAQWSFAQRAMVDGADAVHTNAQGQVDGRAIASVPAAYRAGYLTEVESYAVSSGATLKMRSNAQIRGLTIDCSGAGAGTIDGATFAANGTIDVTGLAKGVREASLKFDLVNASGFANVANWALTENGVPTTKLSVSVNEDGTVTIRRNGLMLIVR